MKNKFLFLTLLCAGFLTSCLKDDKYALDPSGGTNVVEFYNIVAPTSDYNAPCLVYTKAFEAEAESILTAGVNYAGPENVAPKDIVLQLAVDPAIITTYNTYDASKKYVQLDPSLYSFPTTVTIPKGKKTAFFEIKLKTAQFDFNKVNALAIQITNTSHAVVSGNGGGAIFAVPVKNVLDGIYKIESGFVQRYSAPGVPTVNDALNGSLAGNPDLTLSTINATTVEITNLRWAGGSSSVSGINNLRATLNPVTNQITMSAVGNTTLRNRTGFENSYNPATKTLTLNFEWNLTTTPREVGLVIKWSKVR